jgi:hypothetical protein
MEPFASKDLVEEASCQNGPLQSPNGQNPIERESSPRHCLNETHQESKPNENHDMDILEYGIKPLN